VSRVRFVAEARQEFFAEVAYHEKARVGLGAQFTTAVKDAAARAAAFPQSGSPSVANTRRVMVKGAPFFLFYRNEREGIVIFAVSHHSGRPGYWIERAE
jgi:plasmid stabilization system protein ParE